MIYGWISKGIVEIVGQLTAEKSVTSELRSQLAIERTRTDWFIAHINELKIERAQLYHRLGIFLPVPEMTVRRQVNVNGPSLSGMDDNYVPPSGGKAADLGEILATARDLKEQAERTRAAGNPPADLPFQGFDDLGDEAATAIGAEHTRDGTVVFTR